MRIIFEEVKMRGEKKCTCEGCGKKLKRQKTFSQTINPFNKTKDGKIKDRTDIYSELQVKIAEWQGKPEKCGACV